MKGDFILTKEKEIKIMGAIPWDAIVNGVVGLAGAITNGVQGKKDREQNAENVRQTNDTNKEIAEGTNASNQEIAKQTNETNKQIAQEQNKTNKEIAEQNLKYQQEYNKEIWKREDEQAQKEWDFKLSHGISPLAEYAVNGMGSGGSTEAPQLNYTEQGYTAQGYTAEGYTVEPYLQQSEQLGNTIMGLMGTMGGFYQNKVAEATAEGTEIENEGKKIENKYKETQILMDLQEQSGRLREQHDKHLIDQETYTEMKKTIDLQIEQMRAQIGLTNKQTEMEQEKIKSEKQDRNTNIIMSAINQDIANEQLDYARQTHQDRVKQQEQTTYFNNLQNDEMKARVLKTWLENGQIISAEVRAWAQYNLSKKNVQKVFDKNELAKVMMMLGM